MFHAVTGMIVGGEVKEKSVLVKLRWSPHRDLCAHDRFDVAHELRAPPTFRTKRMDHDVILLAVDCERVRPVRCNLGGRIDQNVPVWKLPFSLAWTICAAVNDLPTGRGLIFNFTGSGLWSTTYMNIEAPL
jgi:hypothetical protein